MNAIWQVLLALLAAVGLLALGWLTFGRLLTPVGGGGGGPVYAVVPASGDGAHLEQDVKGLLWLRGGELARFTIVIADGGLDGTGRAVAAALLARGQGIVLCRRSGWGSTSRHEKGPPAGGLFSARRGRAAHFRRGKADETAFAGRQIGAQMI